MRVLTSLCLFALTVALVSTAQAGQLVESEWRIVSQPPTGRGATEIALVVTIEPGWHVNANDPDRPYLIPTELEIDVPQGTTVEKTQYPQAVLRRLAFAGEKPLRLYEGEFTIGVKLAGAAPASVGGRLRYQACNDTTCLPPRILPVALALGGAAEDLAGAVSRGFQQQGDSTFERWMGEFGLIVTLGLAAVFGLGLNLTPCVYPLVSVTIAYFGGQSSNATGRVALLACSYVLGIALTFSTIGVVAALSGGLFGAALQRPLVLVAIATLLVLLAASNFGLYQFRAPRALTASVGKAYSGVLGALAMGLTMGIVAAPCVGPIIVALLLFVAARQDAVLGFALFFALAIGMGAPYVVLAMAAGSLRRLPRSGEWLTWVEHLFGFALLGLALYFVAPLLDEGPLRFAAPVLVAAAGLYLGFIDRAGRSPASFLALRRAAGLAAFAVAAWLAVAQHAESAISWQPFSPAALADARQSGKPAVVDFTASWCLPCRENDRITFTDPEVGAEAARFVMLRADVTEMTDEMEQWMAHFGVLGVPTILFYGTSGEEEARAVGFVEPRRFLEHMRGLR